MTSKEALLYLATTDRNTEIGDEAKNILWKLVERDTPKKVCYDNLGRSECPSCDKSYLHNGSMNRNIYCGYCGQRLDWSKE